jgi:hypothetical protein
MNTREFNKQYKDYFTILPMNNEKESKLDYRERIVFHRLCESSDLNTKLRLSILKWEIIAASYLTDRPITSDGGWTTCALCRTFIDNQCEGCPVALNSGPTCRYTPYNVFTHYCITNDQYFQTAKQEIRYLKKLLV